MNQDIRRILVTQLIQRIQESKIALMCACKLHLVFIQIKSNKNCKFTVTAGITAHKFVGCTLNVKKQVLSSKWVFSTMHHVVQPVLTAPGRKSSDGSFVDALPRLPDEL